MHIFGNGNTPCWIQIRIYQLDIFVLGTKTRVLNNTVGIAMSVCMAITNLRLALSGIFGIKLFHKKEFILKSEKFLFKIRKIHAMKKISGDLIDFNTDFVLKILSSKS